MSRYGHDVEKDGSKFHVEYGYDYPLSEYFIHVSKKGKLVFAVSSMCTMKCHPDFPKKMRWSNGEILELFEKWEVPEEHRMALAGDMPF